MTTDQGPCFCLIDNIQAWDLIISYNNSKRFFFGKSRITDHYWFPIYQKNPYFLFCTERIVFFLMRVPGQSYNKEDKQNGLNYVTNTKTAFLKAEGVSASYQFVAFAIVENVWLLLMGRIIILSLNRTNQVKNIYQIYQTVKPTNFNLAQGM